MRILFICNLYPPDDLGGMEQLCEEVVNQFIARGHACHVLTSRPRHPNVPLQDGNITRALFLETGVHHYRPADFFLKRSGHQRSNQVVLRQVLDEVRPDLVFVWGMWNLSPAVAYWAEQWMPGRVAYNIASYWPLDQDPHTTYWTRPSRNRIVRVLMWPLAKLALRIVAVDRYLERLQLCHVSCCSQYMIDTFRAAGVTLQDAKVIWNGIDPAPFITGARQARTHPTPLKLLYFGGLLEHKGVHTAIEALGLLKQRGCLGDVDLTIVGGGQPGYEARLRSLTESLDLESKVHFLGRYPRSEIPGLLGKYDVFLFTSIWAEPFGRTIIEAMAAGLAVIGADVGGSTEIFARYSAEMLYSPGDAGALADRIQKLIEHPEMINHLGQLGQELVLSDFTLQRMVDELEDWLEELLV